ncbi:MAG TPA: MarR family transcriptional regulator [Syntrophobacteraceae bacterium]|jgi:DNA-binding MarR family transcriptional regulator|nr:MarR family transcriptional regulator [Syntrophobacteraceae bacterium]HBD09653.1 MarR family transcriptional regulator [Syntrophobacteraceae bacterium]
MIFKDCICFQLGAVSRKITRYYKDRIAPLGLTHGQFFMLVALLDEDGVLPSQLADKTALDRPTTTGLLDRLERDGWIERRLDANDRRTIRVHLTPKALAEREAILVIFQDINGRFLQQFSPTEWTQFQSFLTRLDASDGQELDQVS